MGCGFSFGLQSNYAHWKEQGCTSRAAPSGANPGLRSLGHPWRYQRLTEGPQRYPTGLFQKVEHGFWSCQAWGYSWAPPLAITLAKLHDLSEPPCFPLYNVRWDVMWGCL